MYVSLDFYGVAKLKTTFANLLREMPKVHGYVCRKKFEIVVFVMH